MLRKNIILLCLTVPLFLFFAAPAAAQNFGIDEANPQEKLHINGDLRVSTGQINTDGQSLRFMEGVRAMDGSYEWIGFYSGTTRQGIILYDGQWSGANNLTNEFSITAENNNHLSLNTGSGEHIFLMPKGTGKVGIGTVTPVEKLDVDGNIRTSGHVLTPNRPAFSVYLTSHWTTINSVILYTGVHVNNGNHYNSSTGRFTAPVSGLYQFTFGGIKATGSPSQVGRMDLRRNGSILSPQSRTSEGANYGQSSVTTILFLNAGEFVDTWNTDSGGWYTQYTFFTGFLL